MSGPTIRLDNGTTVTVEESPVGTVVILTNPDAPADLRRVEAGRIVRHDGRVGFQPAPFAPFALSAGALRAIAILVDREAAQ